MMIQQAILHILDGNTHMCVLSQKELDLTSDMVYEYVEKRITRLLHDAGCQCGVFYATSGMQRELQQFLDSSRSFSDVAAYAAKQWYDVLSCCENTETMDALFVLFQDDEGERFFAALLLDNKTAYTHQILDEDGAVYNKLIRHQAILPGLSQKPDGYACIRLSDFAVHFADKKRKLDGEEVCVLPEKVLQCTTSVSGRDAVKLVGTIAASVAEEFGASPVEALSRGKKYLAENAEAEDTFSPEAWGDAAFADSPQLQEAFRQQLAETKLPSAVEISREFAQRTGRQHKIKTDTGIEIIFPSEYIENAEYIQFINHPDGTISIELKHIGKIINK